MSNPRHLPTRNDNIAIEQRTRMIAELNTISENTATDSSGSSTLMKGLTDIDDTDTVKFVKLATSGAIKVNDEDTTKTKDATVTSLLPSMTIYGKDTTYGNLHPVHVSTTGKLQIDNDHLAVTNTKLDSIVSNTNNLTGLTNISDDTSKVNLLADSDGHLKVDVVSQPTPVHNCKSCIHGFTDITDNTTDIRLLANADGKLVVSEDKITEGNSTIAAGGSLQSVLIYGRKNDGTLEPLECSGDRLLVDVVELASSGPISTSTSLSSVQVCGYNESEPTKFRTLKVSSDGTQYVKDSDLNSKWETDITNNIKGDVDSINTSTASMDGKMTRGEGNITGGGSGLFQTLCYGKDQSGNLDPLNVDSNGHLKITINDIESGINDALPVVGDLKARADIGNSATSTFLECDTLGKLSIKIADIKSGIGNALPVSKEVERGTSIVVDENDGGTSLGGQIDAGDFTETIDIDGYKSIWISINSAETDSLELHASHSSTTGFEYYDMMTGEMNGGISYRNDCVVPRYLRIKNQNSTFYTTSSIRVHLAR